MHVRRGDIHICISCLLKHKIHLYLHAFFKEHIMLQLNSKYKFIFAVKDSIERHTPMNPVQIPQRKHTCRHGEFHSSHWPGHSTTRVVPISLQKLESSIKRQSWSPLYSHRTWTRTSTSMPSSRPPLAIPPPYRTSSSRPHLRRRRRRTMQRRGRRIR
jgi:hypothetical protein